MPDSLNTRPATNTDATTASDAPGHSSPKQAKTDLKADAAPAKATKAEARDSIPAREMPADSIAADSLAADSLLSAAPVVKIEKPAAPPPPPAWMSGLEPTARPHDPARDPGVAGLLLALFLILAICLRHSKRFFALLWRDLTSIRSREKGFDERTPADKRLVAVFYLQLVAFMGLLTQSALRFAGIIPGGDWSANLTAALTLLWGGHYAFAQCAYRVVGYTFAPSESGAKHWIRGFNASQVLAGFGLAIPAICAVFWPAASMPALSFAAGVYILTRLVFIAKGFRIFHTNFVSLLYFFSYLCALEIVPLVIIYRCVLFLADSYSL